ncbi:MAG: UTP--glucose-1-phosphate uridylyltransferase GalU [Alphaproteobacteria bacterium]
MHPPIRKAVFPVAGLGTRFLPATKAMPKEMLTVVDRPLIQYVVDEARAAGIEHFIFVTGRNKGVIEDHFDLQVELEATLRAHGREHALEELNKDLPIPGQTSFTRQQSPLGLGHAIWCARELVGQEPFAVLLPDMIMRGGGGCLTGMVNAYNRTGGNIVAVEACDPAETNRYGIVGVGDEIDADNFRITEMVEKPTTEAAPSNLYINGRYILQPDLFDFLGDQKKGAGGEIQLTDAMIALSATQTFTGHHFRGRTFDCGSKIGFLAANIAFALDRDDLRDALTAEIKTLLGSS